MRQELRALLILGVLAVALGSAVDEDRELEDRELEDRELAHRRRRYVKGLPTHGVNVFNGKKVWNFSQASNILSGLPPMEDIGVLNTEPDAMNATSITKDTPADAHMATMFPYMFHKLMGAGKPDPVGPFNVPVYSTPTFTPTSSGITDRHEPATFGESAETEKQGNYEAYRRDGALTLEQYNEAYGRMQINCRGDGTARFHIRMKGVPLALYTAWDIIIKNALTPSEGLMLSPFGGAPNVIATDSRGRGTMSRKLNYCPLDKCMGSERCTAGIIMLYHLDHMVHGSGADLSVQGFGTGPAAANHLMFVTNGKVIKYS